MKVDGAEARCIQESLWKEPSVGKQEEDVDGVVGQSPGKIFCRRVCAVEYRDRL
jgi:hypothetical protein